MARVKKNIFLQGLSGSVGEMVFRQMRDGSMRVSAKPAYKRPKPSPAQKDNQNRFKLAQAHARVAKDDPFYIALAEAAGTDAYHLALSDGMKPPVIHKVEWEGGRVCVIASDDVLVARVVVSILDGEGNLLEDGYAAQPDPFHDPERWEYAPRAEGTLEVTAWDLASNRTMATLSL